MAQTAVKPKIEKDRYTPDGVRKFNPTLPHGTVYSDGYSECKFLQEFEGREVQYRGDHTPVGYTPGQPLPVKVDPVVAENLDLKARLAALEARLDAMAGPKPAPAASPAQKGPKAAKAPPSETPPDGARPSK